ncbi:universal stress protein [Arenivirga flava]|uniref:Universal stress protein n=1 Tax=Arenivirga flava TaxID=1930060 RepID=A0AA37XA86_9MICO|nr:universal stress protein [Arenivirga flava]GMA27583.1 universal stress protein [Arenivirga flava]
MKEIIVAVPPQGAVDRALDWAVRRAVERRLPLRLVSVVGGAIGVVGEGPVVEAAVAAAEERLRGLRDGLQRDGLSIGHTVLRGDPARELRQISEGAETLVIGSDFRGADGPPRGGLGLRVASLAASPVVVVPERPLGERSGVVVGVDGSPISEAAVAFAAAEAERLGEPLVAVSAWSPIPAPLHSVVNAAEYLEAVAALTEEQLALALAGLAQDHPDLRVERRTEQGRAADVLGHAARSARLVVVGTHGRGAIARALLGSVSQEVLQRLDTVTAIVR